MNLKILEFDIKGDDLGYILPLEAGKNIPFDIKRAYCIYDIATADIRGKHAHKKLRQVLTCVRGSCKVAFDDGKEKRIVALDRPNKGVVIEPMVWHEIYDFAPACLLLALADACFDETDYIRDYEEFRRLKSASRRRP